ncbi:hypothetical protein N7533_013243 [Penicillium manginii]|uniref:uncharacterized protein n=1 Tax=Penicillium manginii TaxID=203109 RepID=UPI002548E8AE|nr:uncharacterized protein N7533_013243 [Penicillium manginii]KAJ5734840.1 hypothetical protein N7533_013243 [Penicillium manginii]
MDDPTMPHAKASPTLPTRRDRMAAALRMLMAHDDLDPELLRPGSQWVAAADVMTPRQILPQNTTEQSTVTDLHSTVLPVDPALYAGSPYPVDGPDGPWQNWLGDITTASSSSTTSSNLPSSSGSDFMLNLGWSLNEWDVMLNSSEFDSTSTASTLPDPVVGTPQISPGPLPSNPGDVAMQPPPSFPSAERRQTEESTGQRSTKRQRAHYVIEKRYRAGIHERFEALRDCVETWKQDQQQQRSPASPFPSDADGTDEDHNRNVRLNKAEVLQQAVAYIKLLQEENEVVMEHMKMLIRRFRATKQALQHGQ